MTDRGRQYIAPIAMAAFLSTCWSMQGVQLPHSVNLVRSVSIPQVGQHITHYSFLMASKLCWRHIKWMYLCGLYSPAVRNDHSHMHPSVKCGVHSRNDSKAISTLQTYSWVRSLTHFILVLKHHRLALCNGSNSWEKSKWTELESGGAESPYWLVQDPLTDWITAHERAAEGADSNGLL